MKKATTLLILVILSGVMVFVVAQNKKNSKNVWKYEVSQALYGYEKGNLIVTNDSSGLKGEIEFSSGYKIKMREVAIVKDTLRGSVFIENELVRLKGNMKDSIIVGTVDTSMGKLSFKAKKVASSN